MSEQLELRPLLDRLAREQTARVLAFLGPVVAESRAEELIAHGVVDLSAPRGAGHVRWASAATVARWGRHRPRGLLRGLEYHSSWPLRRWLGTLQPIASDGTAWARRRRDGSLRIWGAEIRE
jgi:hypothetical protein